MSNIGGRFETLRHLIYYAGLVAGISLLVKWQGGCDDWPMFLGKIVIGLLALIVAFVDLDAEPKNKEEDRGDRELESAGALDLKARNRSKIKWVKIRTTLYLFLIVSGQEAVNSFILKEYCEKGITFVLDTD